MSLEQEIEKTLRADQETRKPDQETRNNRFTAITGDAKPRFLDPTPRKNSTDPLDGEHLIEVANQRFELARKVLSEIELEHQLERTKLTQSVLSQIEELKQKAQTRLLALDAEFDRRKKPAKRMMALVSRLTLPSGE